jgi:hypothetical protein
MGMAGRAMGSLGSLGTSGPGDGIQSRFWDWPAGELADTVTAVIDPFQRSFNLIKFLLLERDQAQRKIPVKSIRSRVAEVGTEFRALFRGEADQFADVRLGLFLEFKQLLTLAGPIRGLSSSPFEMVAFLG